jgi:5'-nucleotidase
VQGLRFGDEVRAIDRTANLLDRLGIKTLIVTMHQGDGSLGGGPDACNVAPGIAQTIATTATPKVDAFFTGHSHQQYNCSVNDPAGNPRPVIQGLSFGRLLSVIDIKIDKKTRDVIRSATVADNVIVTRDVTQDPVVKKLVDDAVTKSAPIADRPVGSITADLVRAAPPSGEQPLGAVIADAQLAGTSDDAQIAITNPGGIRADLHTHHPPQARVTGW